MKTALPKIVVFLIVMSACTASQNSRKSSNEIITIPPVSVQPTVPSGMIAQPLTDLPQSEDGGFVLRPGFYETEFKTYCLQPGTPDPSQGDAYLQMPMSGYRKEIVQSVLLNSRNRNDIEQRNIQLLLWSIVSGSDYNRLSYDVQRDASQLLTQKQIFELKGGVIGAIRTFSNATGLLNANSDMKRLFESGVKSYEAYEQIAVRREQSRIIRKGVKYDQWYKQDENYYVRYFPESYKKVKIQVYVPDGVLDTANKFNNEYVVFEPTGQQAIPAFTNAQRLGIGSTVLDIVRVVIKTGKRTPPPSRKPAPTPAPPTGPRKPGL